jgi:hypothetical protein
MSAGYASGLALAALVLVALLATAALLGTLARANGSWRLRQELRGASARAFELAEALQVQPEGFISRLEQYPDEQWFTSREQRRIGLAMLRRLAEGQSLDPDEAVRASGLGLYGNTPNVRRFEANLSMRKEAIVDVLRRLSYLSEGQSSPRDKAGVTVSAKVSIDSLDERRRAASLALAPVEQLERMPAALLKWAATHGPPEVVRTLPGALSLTDDDRFVRRALQAGGRSVSL